MRSLAHGTRVRCALAGLFAVVLLAGGCGDLFTGNSEDGRHNWAVVVGISEYDSPSLALRWGAEDALDFYDALRRGRNWDADKITLLTNASATGDAIKSAIAGLAKRVGTDDQIVFYFAGRGTYGTDQPPFDEGDGLDEYLLPYDALTNLPNRDLSDDELEALFSTLPTNNILIVIDAGFACGAPTGVPGLRSRCYLRKGSGAAGARGIDGMTHDLARPGYVLLDASQGPEPAFESNQLRNGVFTYYLVEGMLGAASPRKKAVSAQQAFEYAASRTKAFSVGQSPQIIDNRGKRFGLLLY